LLQPECTHVVVGVPYAFVNDFEEFLELLELLVVGTLVSGIVEFCVVVFELRICPLQAENENAINVAKKSVIAFFFILFPPKNKKWRSRSCATKNAELRLSPNKLLCPTEDVKVENAFLLKQKHIPCRDQNIEFVRQHHLIIIRRSLQLFLRTL